MRRLHPLIRTFAVLMVLTAPAAFAQSCVGFTDVLASNSFCANVEWVKNRGITQGCNVPGTLYCPDQPVIRLHMAAFLNRLGTALTPVDLTPVTAPPAVLTPGATPGSGPILCATPDYVVTNFPRRAYVTVATVLSSPTASIDVGTALVYSTNAGVSWTVIPNSDQYAALYSGATPPQHATLMPFGSLDLSVGQSVRFGVQLDRFAGSGNVTAACSNRVQIWNRNGTTPPLDSQPVAATRQRPG